MAGIFAWGLPHLLTCFRDSLAEFPSNVAKYASLNLVTRFSCIAGDENDFLVTTVSTFEKGLKKMFEFSLAVGGLCFPQNHS